MSKQIKPPPGRYLVEMAAFAKVVQAKSFSKAAGALGLTRSAVSKHVGRLEQALRARLLNRTTRALSLTDTGAAVYQHCERILAAAEDAANVASELGAVPRGMLRVSTSVAFGRLQLVPLLPEFLARHPELSVQLLLVDRYVDLVEEGFDVVLRLNESLPPNLVAKRLASIEYTVCASPAYLKRAGTPQTLADLAKHNCLYYHSLQTAGHDRWQFHGPKSRVEVTVRGNLQVNSSEALRDMLLAGAGIALLPRYVVAKEIKSGRLRPVLKRYRVQGMFGTNVYALYFPMRFPSPKVRAFVDFLAAKFQPNGGAASRER